MGQNLKNEIDLIVKFRIYTIAPEKGKPKLLPSRIDDETDHRKRGTDDGLRRRRKLNYSRLDEFHPGEGERIILAILFFSFIFTI